MSFPAAIAANSLGLAHVPDVIAASFSFDFSIITNGQDARPCAANFCCARKCG